MNRPKTEIQTGSLELGIRYVRLALNMVRTHGIVEAGNRLSLIDAFVGSNGNSRPPDDLVLGITVEEDPSTGYAIVKPSRWVGQPDRSYAVGVFTSPCDLARILVGDPLQSSAGLTREATFLFRSVPVSLKSFLEHVEQLKRTGIPRTRLGNFANLILHPIVDTVIPPGSTDPPTRMVAFLWVPYETGVPRVRGQNTALLSTPPLSQGELFAHIAAINVGKYPTGPFEGPLEENFRRAAPLEPHPVPGAFVTSNGVFRYFLIEPPLDDNGQSVSLLSKLAVDYLLHLWVVGDQVKGSMLVRMLDWPTGRYNLIYNRLMEICPQVHPITHPDHIVRAHWAFVPGAVYPRDLSVFPVTVPRALITPLTASLTTPKVDGNIFLGREVGGAPYFIGLRRDKFEVPHLLFVGRGASGKTTIMNLLGFQIGGTNLIDIKVNTSSGEAAAVLCSSDLLGPYSEYSPPKMKADGTLEEGIHYVCTPPTTTEPKEPGRREYLFNFVAGADGINEKFHSVVLPEVTRVSDEIKLSDYLPLTFSPAVGSSAALFAGAMSTLLTGMCPWGIKRCRGLLERIADGDLNGNTVVLRFDDVALLPPRRQGDPNDSSGIMADSLRHAIVNSLSAGHKEGMVVMVGVQTYDDLEQFNPGTLQKFHFAFLIDGIKDANTGVTKRMLKVIDPQRNEVVVEVDGTIENRELLRLFSRWR